MEKAIAFCEESGLAEHFLKRNGRITRKFKMKEQTHSVTDINYMCTGGCLEDSVLLVLKDPWSQPTSVVIHAVKATMRYMDERMSAEPIQSKVFIQISNHVRS